MGILDSLLGRRAKGPQRPKDDELFDDEFQRKLDWIDRFVEGRKIDDVQ